MDFNVAILLLRLYVFFYLYCECSGNNKIISYKSNNISNKIKCPVRGREFNSIYLLFQYKGYYQKEFYKLVKPCFDSCCERDACKYVAFEEGKCRLFPHQYNSFSVNGNKKFQIVKDVNIKNRQKRGGNGTGSSKQKTCELELSECGKNEICTPYVKKSRNGICQCLNDYIWSNGSCNLSPNMTSVSTPLPLISANNSSNTLNSLPSQKEKVSTLSSTTLATEAEPQLPQKLLLNVNNKTVEIHEGSEIYKGTATLSAYAIGEESAPKYNYKWTLLEKPKNEEVGSYSDMNSQTISLTNLVAGTYSFKVEVDGENVYGETVGSIVVLPTSHVNVPPVAKIEPAKKIVKLPTSVVILDGSSSFDDKEIISYQWEVVMSPIGYKVVDGDSNLKSLQLTNLVPGNYSIMLKVKDEAGLEGNTTASITIIKETDYPPTPNAGGDKIIYLPQTEVILNGNSSTDDHDIVEWEWISGPENSGKAVDMQDSRTPYLKLSNLEVGHYHFILKVTDSSGQSTNASAQLYVHSSADNFPQSNAGKNITMSIPNTTVTLDGSLSEQVFAQTVIRWKQIVGPNTANILSPNELKTNATGLTKGVYIFSLILWNSNDDEKKSISNMSVIVLQEKNVPPKARAGGDFSIVLPISVILVNGTSSSDDVGVSKWQWVRDSSSLAAGKIIKNSDRSPILLFTDVVPGRYIWNLTVWDDQGLSSTDTVSIIVKDGPHHLNDVEIIVGVGVEMFSISQRESLIQKMELLLHSTNSNINLIVQSIRGIPLSGKVSLIVYGQIGDVDVPGLQLVEQLRTITLTTTNAYILDVPIINIDTVVCQNNCSGHGDCIQSSRECLCHSWWMESSFRRHFADRRQNCDWSVVYVFIGTIGSSMVFCVVLWGMALGLLRCIRKDRFIKCKSTKYELLDGEGVKSHIPASLFESDSETCSETEVLFESKKSAHKYDRSKKNGHIRLQRVKKA